MNFWTALAAPATAENVQKRNIVKQKENRKRGSSRMEEKQPAPTLARRRRDAIIFQKKTFSFTADGCLRKHNNFFSSFYTKKGGLS